MTAHELAQKLMECEDLPVGFRGETGKPVLEVTEVILSSVYCERLDIENGRWKSVPVNGIRLGARG